MDVAAGTASMQLTNFALFNGWTVPEANFGGGRDPVPATVDVGISWSDPQEPVERSNSGKGFDGTFVHNVATMSWPAQWGDDTFVAQPFSDGFAMVGKMRNGHFFDPSVTAVAAESWGRMKRQQATRSRLYSP